MPLTVWSLDPGARGGGGTAPLPPWWWFTPTSPLPLPTSPLPLSRSDAAPGDGAGDASREVRCRSARSTLASTLHLIKDYDDCIGVGEARLRHDWIVSIWAGSSAGIGCGAASSFCDHRRDI